jgi:hypothetical protein
MGISNEGKFIPTRSSLLTRLLFEGRHQVECFLIACISPEKEWERETHSTLDFVSTGLLIQSWWQPQRPLVSRPSHPSLVDNNSMLSSDTELLRYAICRLKEELKIERGKRQALEIQLKGISSQRQIFDVSVSSSSDLIPALVQNFPSTDTGKLDSRKKGSRSHPVSNKLTDESTILIQEDSPRKCRSDIPMSSVLSQSWRHSQYDEILKRLWSGGKEGG